MSDDSSHADTHQVLALAVGLGVGVPVILAILVIVIVTLRHRKLVREEDARHDAIDLDREISFNAERRAAKRHHRPVPGSATYLAKQHAASQRDLSVQQLGPEDRLVPPPSRDGVGSIMSHESTYAPDAHTASVEDLTRDLGTFDAYKYPKIPQLHSSSSSGSLGRDEWSRRTSFSESVASSPLVDRQKSQGHAAVLKLYDSYQPRMEEQRRPSTLEEEDEQKSPFEQSSMASREFTDADDTRSIFSFDEAAQESAHSRNSFAPVQHDHEPHEQLHEQNHEKRDEPEEDSTFDKSYDQSFDGQRQSFVYDRESSVYQRESSVYEQYDGPNEPQNAQGYELRHDRQSSVYEGEVLNDSFGYSEGDYSHGPRAAYTPSLDHSSRTPSGTHSASTANTSRSSAPMHGQGQYAPSAASAPIPPPHSEQPSTPQLESAPLSPSTPLHSVPFSPAARSSHTSASQPGSRRGSLSEYMPDVPIVMPKSPRSAQHNSRGQATLDSNVFMERPKKFGKKTKFAPSASQIAL